MWGGWLKQSELPYTFRSFQGPFHRVPAERWVSLACRPGRLVVRVVFKVTEVPEGWDGVGRVLTINNVLGTLASNPSDITRCELQLPSHKADDFKSEVEAALRSNEVNCRAAKGSTEKVGQWYSDTGYLDWEGCDAVEGKKVAKYEPTVPYIIRNPGPGFIVAKFEVQVA